MVTALNENNNSRTPMLDRQARTRLVMKDLATHPVDGLRNFYTAFYATGDNEDSPVESRVSLGNRINQHAHLLGEKDRILDVGAGMQILEAQAVNPNIRPKITTVDIADLTKGQLLTDDVAHTQANGSCLPFPDDTFPVVASNLAVDFMPKKVYNELHRVTIPNGRVILNLHHPSLNLNDREQELLGQIVKKNRWDEKYGRVPKIKDQLAIQALRWRKHLADQHQLFESKTQIRNFFEQEGFDVKTVEEEKGEGGNRWWRVDLVKK